MREGGCDRTVVTDEDDLTVLRLMAEGLTWTAIARRVGCSERTVRRRISRMMEDEDVTTPIELVVNAVRSGRI